MTESYDVVVVGGGNAAFSAAHAARERSSRVLLLEKAPRKWAGGNTFFTAGAFRTTFGSIADLIPLLEDAEGEKISATDLEPYTNEDFVSDMRRLTQDLCDPDLTRILVDDSLDAMSWLHDKGIQFRLMYDRQSFQVDGRWKFWGGLVLGTVGGGKGLVDQHISAAEKSGVEIRYESSVVGLLKRTDGTIEGVSYRSSDGTEHAVRAEALILAGGGFEANPEMRDEYLGSGWRNAKVRGTPHNTGEVLLMALESGAQQYGQWSGCHAVAWDAAAPSYGDRKLTNLLTKQSYPISIVVNKDGDRFIDEGADFRNYTYAKYGAAILHQPEAVAFQLFDAKMLPLLRQDEYTVPGVSRYKADTIEGLAAQLDIEPKRLVGTVEQFNSAVRPGAFNPAIKDGKRTEGIEPPKSNWAQPLDEPPFHAFAVTCGITFTFGGLRIDGTAHVLNSEGKRIPGLYAAGELVGGLFYYNYPGGSGLTSGTVFGRRAGTSAADYAATKRTWVGR